MNRLSRTTALKTAAVLSFVASLLGIAAALPIVAQGADAIASSGDTPPYVIMLLALVIGVVGIIAAFGAWKGQRWGVILTILVNLLNALSAAPGILFAPTTQFWIAAILGVVLSIVIIVLCLWPDRQQTATA